MDCSAWNMVKSNHPLIPRDRFKENAGTTYFNMWSMTVNQWTVFFYTEPATHLWQLSTWRISSLICMTHTHTHTHTHTTHTYTHTTKTYVPNMKRLTVSYTLCKFFLSACWGTSSAGSAKISPEHERLENLYQYSGHGRNANYTSKHGSELGSTTM